MTEATRVFLAQLSAHVGRDARRRESLCAHIKKATGRDISGVMLWRYLRGKVEPGTDVAIPMMRWLQLEGVLIPTKKEIGLFAYSNPLKKPARGVKTSANRR